MQLRIFPSHTILYFEQCYGPRKAYEGEKNVEEEKHDRKMTD